MANTVVRTFSGYLCVDCVQIHANGDHDDERAREAYRVGMADWLEDGDYRVILEWEDDPHFVNFPRCIVCGTRWAGDYWEAQLTLIKN